MKKLNLIIVLLIAFTFKSFGVTEPNDNLVTVIRVPADYTTIKEAINAANEEDVIIISRGTYILTEPLIVNKNITISSEFINSNNQTDVDLTIITSNQNLDPLIKFVNGAEGSKCIGITFKEARKQVSIECDFMDVTNCKFFDCNSDALSFEGGGGYVAYNYFENAGDDAIDADNSLNWVVEYNTIINPDDDGIEVRLHNNNGASRLHIFRYNFISGADEDGIQLIDYIGNSGREFHIHHNVILNSAMVGLGCTAPHFDENGDEVGTTVENFNGSNMVEKVYAYNNTFNNNNHGITGGNNMLVFNNIISNSSGVAIKKLTNNSKADYNCIFNNAANFLNAANGNHHIFVNPLYKTDFSLESNSPCIENGIITYSNSGLSHTVANSDFLGGFPDIGAKEFDGGSVENIAPTVLAGSNQVIEEPTNQVNLSGVVTDDGLPTSGSLTTAWTVESTPINGNVDFGNPNNASTSATFSKQGTYVLKLTANDGELSSSDKITIFYVNDFNDNTVTVGSNFIEAEDYRYLVGGARVLNNSEASAGKIVNAESGQGTWAYTEYRLVTSVAATHYVWVNASGPNSSSNGLKAAFNDLEVEIPFNTTTNNSFDDNSWVKLTFDNIPEGVYPLRISASEEGVNWDRIFITTDPNTSPVSNNNTNTLEVRISSGSDDAEEKATGSVNVGSSDLELVFAQSNQIIGMRFKNLSIPQGATITNAYIQFQVDESSSESTSLTFKGQDTDNASTFTTSSNNITSRVTTTASVNWSPSPWTTVGAVGNAQKTPELKSIVQEIVNRSGWESGNDLAIIVTGSGKRTAESYNGDATGAPLLHIEYETEASLTDEIISVTGPSTVSPGEEVTITTNYVASTDRRVKLSFQESNPYASVKSVFIPITAGSDSVSYTFTVPSDVSSDKEYLYLAYITIADTGNWTNKFDHKTIPVEVVTPNTQSLDVQIASGSDDAEEKASGSMYLTSSDIELVFNHSIQTVGMRFKGVTIPQDATITNAYIQFKVDETNSEATSLVINGENINDALTFTNVTNNITNRNRTSASVNWSPLPWTTVGVAGIEQRTPNLKSIIQEIVNRSGWVSGNALAIIVNGSGERTAESFEGDASAAPLLHIEYQISTQAINSSSENFLKDYTSKVTKIYPVPNKGSFFVELANQKQTVIRVFNHTGKIIYSKIVNNTLKVPIDLKNVSKGIYIISISTAKETINKQIMID